MRRQSGGGGGGTPQRSPAPRPSRSSPPAQQQQQQQQQRSAAGGGAARGCSRALWRQAERFLEAEARGSAQLGACAAQLERAALVRRRAELGLAPPGRLAQLPVDLPARLEARLLRAAESALEQLRLVLEELEVAMRAIQQAVSPGLLADEEAACAFGDEYWRKRQLLEAALITDPLYVFEELRRRWPMQQPSPASAAASAASPASPPSPLAGDAFLRSPQSCPPAPDAATKKTY
jgi:hypothetical protein